MFDCVMPAAGASSRMGDLKPLLPFAGSTLVEAAVGAALDAGCRVLLVVGNRGAEVASPFGTEAHRAARERGRFLVVDNPNWERGLLGSIQAALSLVVGDAFFLAHADMPFIESVDYRALAEARAERTSNGLADAAFFASHDGVRGHPVLLPSAWIPEMLALDARGMMKDFLADRPIALVETGRGALRDIDTPEDYEAAMEGP
ncbi:MAG: NTP transferase domain-containing protein [Rectinemataceae bacterium]|jgi:molybdenum cofactor cytidylyltransferase